MTVLLSATGLTRRFGRLAALAGVDLELRPGERRAVIGPNGAGKTTLVNLVAGTLYPTSGRLTFAGRDITVTGPARRARLGIARTFQTPALADTLSALDNVVLGAWRHQDLPAQWRVSQQRRLAREALRQLDELGIGQLAHLPAGQLAHGQRRLLDIAVALVAQPRLLLLDEPAAGLTDRDLPRLLEALHRLPTEVTVLLVEHHMDVVTAVAETVTVLHHGRVLAEGAPPRISTHPAVAEVYLGEAGQPVGG